MKLTYENINNDMFNQALYQLSLQKDFPTMKSAYTVAKIWRRFEKELKHARELFAKWAPEYYEKTEDGKPQAAEVRGVTPFKIAEGKKEAFEAKLKEFLALEVEIDCHPLTMEDLKLLKLAPQQILALEPILDPSVFSQLESL